MSKHCDNCNNITCLGCNYAYVEELEFVAITRQEICKIMLERDGYTKDCSTCDKDCEIRNN